MEPCVFISDESVNGQANEDTNINNTKLKNQNIKSTITTAVTHSNILYSKLFLYNKYIVLLNK